MSPTVTRARVQTGRYRLTRAGIFNVWQYDDQVFEFHQGRLLLRGKNGSGKTKALELLLPFLLDADQSPSRLDPAGGNVKGMKYNLLDDDQTTRVGYVWVEFGRLNETGNEEYVTLGAGLRASQSSPSPDAWYFITTQRVGRDLKLEGDGNLPLTRDRLRTALATHGRICDSATDYKAEVDEKLFGLGAERYKALVDLLINLRRPQLSKALDPKILTDALSESLPPLDEAMIGRIADAFNELEKQQRALAEVSKARDAVANFLKTYEAYAKILAKSKAARVRATKEKLDTATRALEKARRREERLGKEVEGLDAKIQEHKREQERVKGRIDALRARPEAKQASELQRLVTLVNTLRAHAEGLRQELARLNHEIKGDAERLAATEREMTKAAGEEAKISQEVGHLASKARGDVIHEILTSGRDANGRIPAEIEQRWEQRVRSRANDIVAVEAATEKVKKAEADKLALDGEQSRADAAHRERTEAARLARQAAQTARAAAESAAEAWRSNLQALSVGEETFDAILQAFDEADLQRSRHLAILQGATTTQEDGIIDERRLLDIQRHAQEEQAARLRENIEEWRKEKDSPPPAPAWQRRARADRQGAAFYRIVDFRAGVPAKDAALLEAALAGAGVLDAWVTPQGRIDLETLDTFLLTGKPQSGRTALDLLEPVDQQEVPRDVIARLLRAIPLVERAPDAPEDQALAVGVDGSWRVGPLRGRTAKEKAEHIGEAAREQARLRKIEQAQGQLSDIEKNLSGLKTAIEEKSDRIRLVRAEAKAFPTLEDLSKSYKDLASAIKLEESTRETLIDVQRRVAVAREEVAKQQKARRELARDKGLEDIIEALAAAKRDLETYRHRCAQWFRAVEAAARIAATYNERAEEIGKKRGRAKGVEAEFNDKDGEATRNEAELDAIRASSGKAIDQLLKELGEAEARFGELGGIIESTMGVRMDRFADHRAAKLEHVAAGTDVGDARKLHAEAADELTGFRTTGLIELGTGVEAPPLEDVELAQFVLEHTAGAAVDRAALDVAANLVHPQFQLLSRELSSNEYSVTGSQVHDAFVVTITHAGKESTARQMHASLQQEAEVQATLLEKRETELIQKHLFGEVSSQIRQHVRKAHELVAEMNRQLEAHPTASGLRMKLDWALDPEVGKPAERALNAMRKAQNMLTDSEKRLVTEFLQDCQKKAREDMPTATSSEQLMRALDYRKWFRFDLSWKKPGQAAFSRLTKKTHATGSAGEKAVALYLPLFAAAAAHFDSARPTAPRLVLLDEVFAGVDQTTRGSCMGLLVDFDLDVMMTAFSEWGCYPEVSGIAIYHLERDPDARGVLAAPFWWDGKVKRELTPEA